MHDLHSTIAFCISNEKASQKRIVHLSCFCKVNSEYETTLSQLKMQCWMVHTWQGYKYHLCVELSALLQLSVAWATLHIIYLSAILGCKMTRDIISSNIIATFYQMQNVAPDDFRKGGLIQPYAKCFFVAVCRTRLNEVQHLYFYYYNVISESIMVLPRCWINLKHISQSLFPNCQLLAV